MANDKNPGQRNMEEVETGEADRRQEKENERRQMEEAERRARQGSQQPGGKDARPWTDRRGDGQRGPGSDKKY